MTMEDIKAQPAVGEPLTAGATDHIHDREIPLSELADRGFDVATFLEAIEPLPLFLQAPVDALAILARHA
jgi:hypothetical protein